MFFHRFRFCINRLLVSDQPRTGTSAEGRKHQLDTFGSRRSLRADVACGGQTAWTAASPSTAVIADGASTDEPMTASDPGRRAQLDDAEDRTRCGINLHPWSRTSALGTLLTASQDWRATSCGRERVPIRSAVSRPWPTAFFRQRSAYGLATQDPVSARNGHSPSALKADVETHNGDQSRGN